MADSIPHQGEGTSRKLTLRHGPACSFPTHLTPACPVANMFFLTGDICGLGQGRRGIGWHRCTQEFVGRKIREEGNNGDSWRWRGSMGRRSGENNEEGGGDRNKRDYSWREANED